MENGLEGHNKEDIETQECVTVTQSRRYKGTVILTASTTESKRAGLRKDIIVTLISNLG